LWFCRRNKDTIEEIRKKVEKGKRRKMDRLASQTDQTQTIADPSSEMPGSAQLSATPTPKIPKTEPCDEVLPMGDDSSRDEQEDFDFVREFFASGAGDRGTEDEVWKTMAIQRTCKTAQTWKQFCDANCGRIAKEQQTLL